MIRLRNIDKAYRTGFGQTFVLRRIDLDVKQGEFITIMGPSGSGKSSLLNILGMLDGSWTGEYELFDQAIHKLDHKKRMEIGKRYICFVFHSYHLIYTLTLAYNLDIPLA